MHCCLRLLGLLLAVSAAPALADSVVVFTLPSRVRVHIAEAPVKRHRFRIEGCSSRDAECRINGQVAIGLASEPPKSFVKSITLYFNGQSATLEVSGMFNAWGNRALESNGARYFGGTCTDDMDCQVRGVFGDASHRYAAEWRIARGVAQRTVFTDSTDVVKLFLENIDPPDFG